MCAYERVRARVYVCVCLSECVRECVPEYVRAFVRVRACVRACTRARARACVCVCVCVCLLLPAVALVHRLSTFTSLESCCSSHTYSLSSNIPYIYIYMDLSVHVNNLIEDSSKRHIP